MTASASILGTVRTIPDAPAAPLPESGVPTHANFQSVLEQYHAPRKSDSKSDGNQNARQQKPKESDSTSALAVLQPETPNVDTPRAVLPFTTSIQLRQSATASTDDAASQEPSAAADPTAEPSAITNMPSTPANMRSTLDLHNLKSTKGGAQPKAQAKSQDSTPSGTAAAPLTQIASAEPSIANLPVTSSTTFEQAATVAQNRFTVSESRDSVSNSTSDRGIVYQRRSSNERPVETAVINRGSRETQRKTQNVPDTIQNVIVPIPGTSAVVPQPLIHPSVSSNTPRQEAKALDSGSAVPQDSSTASGTDPKNAIPPALDRAEDTTAASPQGSLAFAARLTPTEDTSAPAPDANRTTDPQSRPPAPLQAATPATAKGTVSDAGLPANQHSGESGSQSDKEKTSDRFAKPEMLLPQTHTLTAVQTAALPTSHVSTSPLSPAARMDQVQDPPAPASSGNHDITIRIPDSTDQGTAVRFVERAGEVHVSVRTGDVEMAQTLRGGLNDLVGRLEDGGIRTQVWQPGADAATSQNDSHQPFADPDGSNSRQYSSGSNSEQESRQQNKPRWVEELESSIGKPNFKETTQLLWQA